MTQYINDILNDFDAEFGLDRYSSMSQQESPMRRQGEVSDQGGGMQQDTRPGAYTRTEGVRQTPERAYMSEDVSGRGQYMGQVAEEARQGQRYDAMSGQQRATIGGVQQSPARSYRGGDDFAGGQQRETPPGGAQRSPARGYRGGDEFASGQQRGTPSGGVQQSYRGGDDFTGGQQRGTPSGGGQQSYRGGDDFAGGQQKGTPSGGAQRSPARGYRGGDGFASGQQRGTPSGGVQQSYRGGDDFTGGQQRETPSGGVQQSSGRGYRVGDEFVSGQQRGPPSGGVRQSYRRGDDFTGSHQRGAPSGGVQQSPGRPYRSDVNDRMDYQTPMSDNADDRYRVGDGELGRTYDQARSDTSDVTGRRVEGDDAGSRGLPEQVTMKVPRISVEEASEIIEDLRKKRVQDAERMEKLQVENARLLARVAILEHTDLRVAELGAKVEQLLQKYLESEQTRTQQAAQVSELRQEVVVLKARLSRQ